MTRDILDYCNTNKSRIGEDSAFLITLSVDLWAKVRIELVIDQHTGTHTAGLVSKEDTFCYCNYY